MHHGLIESSETKTRPTLRVWGGGHASNTCSWIQTTANVPSVKTTQIKINVVINVALFKITVLSPLSVEQKVVYEKENSLLFAFTLSLVLQIALSSLSDSLQLL